MTAVASPPEALAVSLTAANASAVPTHDAWLASAELLWLSGRRVAKRRTDWRLGRWVAKRAVARAVGAAELEPSAVEILGSAGGAPTVRIHAAGAWPDVSLSLSHSGGTGFAAAAAGSVRLGCDLEAVTPHTEAFVTDYFTPSEAAWIRADAGARDLRATLLWSAKEAALKALGEGLRVDTRSVEVVDPGVPDEDGAWQQVTADAGEGRVFEGWWRRTPGYVWTLVKNRRGDPGFHPGHPPRVPATTPPGV